MKQNLIIFGNGTAARLAKNYFDSDSNYQVVAFTVDKPYINIHTFEGLPLLDFETIEQVYPITDYFIFVALGYSQMNDLRANKYLAAKQKGYRFASYISSHSTNLSEYPVGENAFILEGTVIQPFAQIGNNVCMLVGNGIGHNCIIEDHNFITSHAVVCGHAVIKPKCFLGVNAIVGEYVTLGEKTLVGVNAYISKNTEAESVYVSTRAIKLDKKSSDINL